MNILPRKRQTAWVWVPLSLCKVLTLESKTKEVESGFYDVDLPKVYDMGGGHNFCDTDPDLIMVVLGGEEPTGQPIDHTNSILDMGSSELDHDVLVQVVDYDQEDQGHADVRQAKEEMVLEEVYPCQVALDACAQVLEHIIDGIININVCNS